MKLNELKTRSVAKIRLSAKRKLDADIKWISKKLAPIECLHSPLWVYDIDNSRVLWCTQSSLSVWQSDSVNELLSREMGANMSLSVSKRLNQYKADFTNDADIQFKEIWTLYPNGEPTTFDVVFSSFRLDTGRMCMFCEVINQKIYETDALRCAEALLHTPVNISLYSVVGEPLYRNPAARGSVRAADSTLSQYFGNSDLTYKLLNSKNDEINAVSYVNTDRGEKWHDVTARRCMDAVSGEEAWLISEVDVTSLKIAEERAKYLAEHDTLTQLPNRAYVSNFFQAHIDRLSSVDKSGALMFIDLDNFKDVNDALGHYAGDKLLVEVSNRLLSVSKIENSVARLGGDEFVLLISLSNDANEMDDIAQEIIELISQSILIQGREIQVTPSIGIALFPQNGQKINDLMRHADLAMYHAKDAGKNNYSYYKSKLSDAVESRIGLESEIKRALLNDEFVAFFQPKVDIDSGTIVGAEALARWQHKDRGIVQPSVFIPVCESSGLISDLGDIIFTQAVIAQRNWAEKGYDLCVSVNLSPLQFAGSNLVDDLIRIVQQCGGNAERIELEITESVLLGNDQETTDKLQSLVEYGFQISIDDFGTGYSSLAYLHRYPVNCLKIDRSFIQALNTAKPIVELIISMAKLFGMYVVAEGVENKNQLEYLRTNQCQQYQGFLCEKPIDVKQFTQLVHAQALSVA